MKDKIFVFSRVLTDRTGIFGPNRKGLARGLYWDRIKNDAMKLSAPFDLLEIDLDNEEQKLIQDCIKKQIDFDNKGKNAN